MNLRAGFQQRVASVLLLSMLAACASRQVGAPVVDRTVGGVATDGSAPGAAPVIDNTPVPAGYYRVKPGDRLYRIALENGQNYRDIARWNNIQNADQIEVGQVLRVKPPAGDTGTPLPAPLASNNVASVPPAVVTPPASASATAAPSAPSAVSSGELQLSWPAKGNVVGRFDDSKNKGLNIGGTVGEPVYAAGAGKVVYSGAGLRGYGNLVIIKHDATFLTAYAHNRTLLVKEGDSVTRGQKIAEMGNSDADRVMLHFEVRRDGKPVDPMKYLPPQ
ncbi:MAG: peptidoglycan DD-metalloendopeptidase family protein [Pandoraea sp.]|uniref:Murein hydrolase activator NlpD n=2 Tax=Burkholderiaceae TaxID=119060 RepID=A0A5E4XVY8_9BURK|nr:peptidoglycan DD-metalloendopeptidase family protein [Pandoraea sp.]OJY19567.1 MAG: peptidase [Pandoraea sp. 64-18]QBC31474.1 peptidase [Pandoraea sp. XY-2]BDD94675.1 peptidase [Pandoraea sp. NE5]VVE40225.1 Murein hydrolase activator NlpD [Pandoraea cepalis]